VTKKRCIRGQIGNCGPGMYCPSELAGFWSRLADLDAEIAECHADGYAADVDRLLDERAMWQQERDALFRGLARSRRPA
jgi:hypothetical protein